MVFTVKSLIDVCCHKRGRMKPKGKDKREVYEELWRALNEWMWKTFEDRKGLRIPQLGEWNWEFFRAFVGKVGQGTYKMKRRPFFQLADHFSRTYRIQMRKAVKPPKLAKCEELNATKIAIKFSTILSKDMVFSGLRDFVTRIGEAVTNGEEVAISLCLGVLHARNRQVAFQFDPKVFPKMGIASGAPSPMRPVPENHGTEGGPLEMTGTGQYAANEEQEQEQEQEQEGPAQDDDAGSRCESEAPPPRVPDLQLDEHEAAGDGPASYDSEDEFGVGVMPSERSEFSVLSEQGLQDSKVVEEAYRRHLTYVQQMVEESAFEKSQFVKNLQNQEMDARARRQKRLHDNKQLQNFLRTQVKSRALKTKSKREKDLTTKTHCSFPPLVHSAANGVPGGLCRMTNAEQQKRVRMRAALKTQMDTKEQLKNMERSKQLEEERQFLQQVQNRMLDNKEKMQQKRLAVKEKLLQAWERDKKMKQLLRQGIKLQSTIRNGTLPTARSAMSEFSVGYDQRG